jgi:hypothetical protein
MATRPGHERGMKARRSPDHTVAVKRAAAYARAEKLTPERRSEIARLGAKEKHRRWQIRQGYVEA